jgi:type IV pilus assembly protein PilM
VKSPLLPEYASYSMTKFERTSGSVVVVTGRHVPVARLNSCVMATRDVSAGTREVFEAIKKEFRLNPELTAKALKGEMSDSIDQDMFKATVMSAADELISGIELAFSYFRSQTKIENIDWIVLSGGGALVPYLPEFLQSKINIPLELANPLRNIDYDPELFQFVQPEKIAPLLSVSVGLAMRKAK